MANNEAVNPQELANVARARAAFSSFINIHFTTLPDKAFVNRLREGELTSLLRGLAEDTSLDPEISGGASMMIAYLDKNSSEKLDQLVENLGVDRTRLYRGVAKGYGPPPPNEMEWVDRKKGFTVLQGIAGIYRGVGLEPSPEVKERLDYISVELDFIGTLATREAEAWDSGDADKASNLLSLENSFMSEHLGVWVPAFIDGAMKFVETDFYKGHMIMLRGFLRQQQGELAALVDEMNA